MTKPLPVMHWKCGKCSGERIIATKRNGGEFARFCQDCQSFDTAVYVPVRAEKHHD